jgi:hypothetical protein
VYVDGQLKRNPPWMACPTLQIAEASICGEKSWSEFNIQALEHRRSPKLSSTLLKAGRFVVAPLCLDTLYIRGRMRLIGCASFHGGGMTLGISLMHGSPWRSNSSPVATYGHSHLETGSGQITHDKPVSAEQVALSVTESKNSELYILFIRLQDKSPAWAMEKKLSLNTG